MEHTRPPVFECERPHVENYINARLEVQSLYRPSPGATIMLGDSIIEQGPWTEALGFVNRGIGSATTGLIKARIDEIRSLEPAAVYLSVGINDLVQKRAPGDVAKDIHDALRALDAIWLTVLPTALSFKNGEVNPLVADLNSRIEAPTVDICSALAPQGALREDFCYDGVHLNGKGYARYLETLMR